MNSLSGHLAPKALHLVGFISDHRVTVLIDGGSTHNFVQPQVVTSLSLPCQTISTPLRVMVGNGQYLECASVCEDVLVCIQNNTFTLDLYILPISGANVILGVQWLKTLGLVLTNYSTLSMQFFHQDQLVELRGEHATSTGTHTTSFTAFIAINPLLHTFTSPWFPRHQQRPPHISYHLKFSIYLPPTSFSFNTHSLYLCREPPITIFICSLTPCLSMCSRIATLTTRSTKLSFKLTPCCNKGSFNLARAFSHRRSYWCRNLTARVGFVSTIVP